MSQQQQQQQQHATGMGYHRAAEDVPSFCSNGGGSDSDSTDYLYLEVGSLVRHLEDEDEDEEEEEEEEGMMGYADAGTIEQMMMGGGGGGAVSATATSTLTSSPPPPPMSANSSTFSPPPVTSPPAAAVVPTPSSSSSCSGIASTRSNTCPLCGRTFKAAKFLQVHLYCDHPSAAEGSTASAGEDDGGSAASSPDAPALQQQA